MGVLAASPKKTFTCLLVYIFNVTSFVEAYACQIVWPKDYIHFINPPPQGDSIGLAFEEGVSSVVCAAVNHGERVCYDSFGGGVYSIPLDVLVPLRDTGEYYVDLWCGVGSTGVLALEEAINGSVNRVHFTIAKFPAPDPTGLRSLYLKSLQDQMLGMWEWEYGAPLQRPEFEPVWMRTLGKDWPVTGLTMVGAFRLDNIRYVLEKVVTDGVPGDFLEAGVWRGGAGIFAKGVLKSLGDETRRVWMCDSYEGLPLASTDRDSDFWAGMHEKLAVGLDEVRTAFTRARLLDDRVLFLKGYFDDSLPAIPDDVQFSVIRLDGDMYESYMDCLFNLYDSLAVGGFVIIDEYWFDQVLQAVTEFRDMNAITDPIQIIDDDGVFWRKRKQVKLNMEWYHEFGHRRVFREQIDSEL